MQVNAFFLKYILWLPPLNPLNTYRLTLLFLLAVPATKVRCHVMACNGNPCHTHAVWKCSLQVLWVCQVLPC